MSAPPLRLDGRAWIELSLLSLVWGGSYVFAELALDALPPLTLVWLRVTVAAAALHVAVRAAGLRMPWERRRWAAFAAMGALNNAIPFTLIVSAQTVLTAGLAAILVAATPFLTLLLASRLTADERPTAARLAGVAAGMAGVAITIGPAALAGGDSPVAQLAVLAAALSYALAGLYGRRFADTPAPVVAAGQVTASSALLLPVVLAVDRPWTLAAPGPSVWIAVAGFGILSTALAYVLYFRILARAGATNLLLVTLLAPATAVALGAVLLGEPVAGRALVGMAVIAAGLALVDGRPLAAVRRRVAGRTARRGEPACRPGARPPRPADGPAPPGRGGPGRSRRAASPPAGAAP